MYKAYYIEDWCGEWQLAAVTLDNRSGVAKFLWRKVMEGLHDQKVKCFINEECNFPIVMTNDYIKKYQEVSTHVSVYRPKK